jgi:hypothetical protein
MIIWINGAFGAGKSQTAYELHRRLPGSFIYDPERIGYFLQANMPAAIKQGDFQQYPMWREFNYTMLMHLYKEWAGPLIVPMTIVDLPIFAEIVGRLRDEGAVVNHFALMAQPDTLIKRLRSRGDGRHSWPAQQIQRCTSGLSDEAFRQHIDTDSLAIEQVVETIGSSLNLDLLSDKRGALKKKTDRIVTQLKQIRWFH